MLHKIKSFFFIRLAPYPETGTGLDSLFGVLRILGGPEAEKAIPACKRAAGQMTYKGVLR